MIQRIQTVFLLVAFVLIGLMFFIPFANLISNDVYYFSLKGISPAKSAELIQQPFWVTVTGSISAILIFVVIFLYKNRKLQMNLCLITILLMVVLNLLMYLFTDKYHILLTAETKYTVAFVFPAISAITVFLAYRGINKDEKLIKSLDRIR